MAVILETYNEIKLIFWYEVALGRNVPSYGFIKHSKMQELVIPNVGTSRAHVQIFTMNIAVFWGDTADRTCDFSDFYQFPC
jgi:hypothetical protein